MKSLFIFRRDLRLKDNSGLLKALTESAEVLPAFIFDPRQTGRHHYRSESALQFMIASLRELDRELRAKGSRLYLFQGPAEKVVAALLRSEGLGAVYCNRDYTPFSRRRDEAIAAACREKNATFVPVGDSLLHEPEDVAKADGGPYAVFTPFFNAARALAVGTPRDNPFKNYRRRAIAAAAGPEVYDRILKRRNEDLFRRGGRREALRILATIDRFRAYEKTRDLPAVDGTTGLSPHNKFGTISIREFHKAVRDCLGPGHPLLRQLYWRDFFTHVAFHFDRVFGHPFQAAYEKVPWNDDPARLKRWQEGTTGFPIVDAGMRQLEATGFMPNRVRMICASFLVKDLRIDWREGERFFATRLEDYDPCVNNGNWQWVASTGCDAAPYFRVFNPWLQQRRYDPDAAYVKRWVPELARTDPGLIHRLDCLEGRRPGGYPEPIADHAAESVRTLAMYRLAKSGNIPRAS
jgi:deoxyribodipyrimidine photo-lyase